MKLSRLSIPYKTVQKVATLVVLILFTSPGLFSMSPATVIVASAGIMLLVSLVATYEYLYWKKFEFKISEDGINITSGVFRRNDKDIPLKRVQNIDVDRNFLHRIVGIAKLNIETAGGSSTEATLKYLDDEEADQIREKVRALKNRRETGEKERSEEDFKLSGKNLGLLSLTSIDLKAIAALGVILSITGGMIGNTIQQNLEAASFFIVLLTIVLLIALIGWAISAARTFEKFFDFSMNFRENALEYERGMINRSSGTIPLEKVQNLVIEENVFQRMLGYATLKVETAGNSQKQQNVSSSEETAIPLAKRSEIIEFAQRIEDFDTPEMKQVDRKAVSRYTRRYLMVAFVLLLASAAAVNFGAPVFITAIPAAIVLVSRKAAKLKWRNIGYALQENHVFTMKGFWNRKTYVLGYFRVQNLMRSETIFQRRWRMRTLEIDTAGSRTTRPVIIDLEKEKAEELTGKLFEKFKRSLRQPA